MSPFEEIVAHWHALKRDPVTWTLSGYLSALMRQAEAIRMLQVIYKVNSFPCEPALADDAQEIADCLARVRNHLLN